MTCSERAKVLKVALGRQSQHVTEFLSKSWFGEITPIRWQLPENVVMLSQLVIFSSRDPGLVKSASSLTRKEREKIGSLLHCFMQCHSQNVINSGPALSIG